MSGEAPVRRTEPPHRAPALPRPEILTWLLRLDCVLMVVAVLAVVSDIDRLGLLCPVAIFATLVPACLRQVPVALGLRAFIAAGTAWLFWAGTGVFSILSVLVTSWSALVIYACASVLGVHLRYKHERARKIRRISPRRATAREPSPNSRWRSTPPRPAAVTVLAVLDYAMLLAAGWGLLTESLDIRILLGGLAMGVLPGFGLVLACWHMERVGLIVRTGLSVVIVLVAAVAWGPWPVWAFAGLLYGVWAGFTCVSALNQLAHYRRVQQESQQPAERTR